MKINIIFPVLNEEKRLENGIKRTIEYLQKNPLFEYQLTIVDNGSNDKTQNIAFRLCRENENVYYIRTEQRGVGNALREGARRNECEFIGYMDVDLSTSLEHLVQVKDIFVNQPDVQIINGSRLHKNSQVTGRKINRQITSKGLQIILKLLFGMKITDCICGFKFFQASTLNSLIKRSSNENGWFFCIELMLRAERLGIQIREIPVRWSDDYNTTVNVPKLIKEYLIQIYRLYKELVVYKRV